MDSMEPLTREKLMAALKALDRFDEFRSAVGV